MSNNFPQTQLVKKILEIAEKFPYPFNIAFNKPTYFSKMSVAKLRIIMEIIKKTAQKVGKKYE